MNALAGADLGYARDRWTRYRFCETVQFLNAVQHIAGERTEVAAPSHDVWLQLFDQLLQTEPRVRRVMSRIRPLNLSRAFGAMRRSLPSFEML